MNHPIMLLIIPPINLVWRLLPSNIKYHRLVQSPIFTFRTGSIAIIHITCNSFANFFKKTLEINLIKYKKTKPFFFIPMRALPHLVINSILQQNRNILVASNLNMQYFQLQVSWSAIINQSGIYLKLVYLELAYSS